MNLHQIELFISVAETGSFSKTAEAAFLNQSTISQHIAALEDELNTNLLDRTPKGALLTAHGEIFLRHARRIILERDNLYQAMSSFRGLQNAQLTIGASNIPANYLVPNLLQHLAKDYPGISLTMVSGDSQEILDSLADAEIELAIVGSRFDHKGINYQPLANDTLALIVGPKHPWKDRKNISIDELAGERFIVREKGSGSGKAIDVCLRSAGFDPGKIRIAARLGSSEAVNQAVISGFGCAFVSDLSIRHLTSEMKIHKVAVKGLKVERQFWLATMKGRTLSPAAEVFCGILQKRYS
jgi:DNA-binding transcriptional LysR family regulator